MSKPVALQGLIIPHDWDQLNNVTKISLSTPGEKDFQIDMDDLGKRLLNHIRSNVQLEGVLSRKNNNHTLRVVRFKVIKQY